MFGKGNLQISAWFISTMMKDIFEVRGNITTLAISRHFALLAKNCEIWI